MKLKALKPLLVLSLLIAPCLAESGYVSVVIEDVQHHPVRLVEIGIEKGASKLTKDDGRAQLPLAQNIKASDWISFQLVHSPPGKDLAIVSPWDNRFPVPSLADKPQNLIKIIVVQKGDRAALESGDVVLALAQKINKANAPRTANKQAPTPDSREALKEIATQYGLTAEDIDTAIRILGTKTNDEKKKGIILLYEGKYAEASAALDDSLQEQEKQFEALHEIERQKERELGDTAFFLGQSLYVQGQYYESAQAYRKSQTYRPDDPLVLNNLALSLSQAGNYAEAEPLYKRAIDIDEKAVGPDHPDVATDINNLAALYRKQGKYDEAETLFKRAINIDEKALGPDHPDMAADVNNLAELYCDQGKFEEAEPLYKRAIDIDEKDLGPDHPNVATALGNLASLYCDQGKYGEAEPLYTRALAIDEKALGLNHPSVARDLDNLATLYDDQDEYEEAESLYRHALTIAEKTLGPDHPDVATDLNNLAELYCKQGKYAEAEPLYKRAIDIIEKALGSDHPHVAMAFPPLTSL